MAAAVQSLTSANSAVTALIEDRHARRTEIPIAAKSPPSPLVPSPPALTDVSKSDRMTAMLPTNKVTDETAPQIPNASHLHSVNAVIDEIMRDSVVIRCLLSDGTLDLRLPPSLIPAELLSFGQPITISLRTKDGIRAPLIERRNIPAQKKFADQQELDTWIESL